MHVQLSPDNETVIGYFSGPQDPELRPDVVEIEASDPRYIAYYDSLPQGARVGLPEPERV